MCGIAGLISEKPISIRRETAQNLMGRLAHRGPDDAGWLAYRTGEISRGQGRPGDLETQVLFLHRRLSILDLSAAGRQPMSSKDGKYHLILNGEIYNYLELRAELERAGHRFVSLSDTEVLLAALQEWGTQCLTRVTGMFAFACLDLVQSRVILARDPFGIKPLYYSLTTMGLSFASEIPALLMLPEISRKVDPQRLFDYIRFGLTDHGSDTLFCDIKQLAPGHFCAFSLQDAKLRSGVYYRAEAGPTFRGNFQEAAEELRSKFLNSVRLHLRSDVPVGAALSGGIDSTSIVCALRRVDEPSDLHVFSYFADDPRLSEESWSRMAAQASRATLHPVYASSADLARNVDRLISIQGEPFGSTTIYAQFKVFEAARDAGIKVMLDGQGADEMLGGYFPFTAARVASLLRGRDYRAALRLLRSASGMPGRSRLQLMLGQFCIPESLQAWFRPLVGEQLFPAWLTKSWFSARGVSSAGRYSFTRSPDVLKDALVSSLSSTSLPMLLRYEDRNSMAHSIESRVPFLTPELVNLVLSFPEEFIIGPRGETKSVFRKAMEGIAPDPILTRQDKIGFGTPEQAWLERLAPWVARNLERMSASGLEMLNVQRLAEDWAQVRKGERRFDWRIWRWNNLIVWMDQFNVVTE